MLTDVTGPPATDPAADLTRQHEAQRTLFAGRVLGGGGTVLVATGMPPIAAQDAGAAADGEHRLWFDKPADRWVDGLPVGNGRIGAMVLGGGSDAKFCR